MIYLANDGSSDYITDLDLSYYHGEDRKELMSQYHEPDAQELWDYIDGLDAWDETDSSAYAQLAELCGVDLDEKDPDHGPDELMDKCEKALRGGAK